MASWDSKVVIGCKLQNLNGIAVVCHLDTFLLLFLEYYECGNTILKNVLLHCIEVGVFGCSMSLEIKLAENYQLILKN